MISYIRTVMAAGVALIAVLGTIMWLNDRCFVLRQLEQEERNVRIQAKSATESSVIAASLKGRLAAVCQDTTNITARFAEKDKEGVELVNAVVQAAAVSGIQMTGAAETVARGHGLSAETMELPVRSVRYQISLRGKYSGLVGFFQRISMWNLAARIESLEIRGPKDERTDAEVDAVLVMSVFSAKG